MDEALVFHNPRKGSCPIYVQDDVSARLISPTKDYIKNFGGIVTDDPQKAIIVVIVNSRTHLGSKLITDYAGEGSGKGVVDQAWVLESIRQGRMLGPPDWGGYVLHRHTVESFFDLADNTPGTVRASSSVTVNARGGRSTSAGQAPLQSPEPSGYTPTNRSPARPSVPQALQRAVFSQQSSSRPTSSPHPRSSIPRPSKARNAPSVAKSRIQGVRTKTAARHLPRVEASTAPQLPAAEDRILMTKCGKFKFTEIEKAYVLAQFEQAHANGPIVLAKVAANISKAMPWHSGISVQNFIRRQQQYKEFVVSKAGVGKGRSRQPTKNANNSKAKQKKSSPILSEGRAQSPSKGSDDHTDSPSEPDSRESTSEPPPTAPPMPKIPPTAVRFAYTEAEKEFIVECLAWGERNDITPKSGLYASIHKLMPWRSEQSIRKFVSNHPELFGKRNIPPQSTRRPLSRAGLEYRLQQSQQKDSASPAEGRQSEDVEPQNSITSAIGEGLASSPDDHRPQAITSSAKGKAPSALSEAVTEAMVLALKDHRESHWASDNRQKRARLWSDFAKTHPNHSAESYYQYHVEHHEQLESAARELTEDGGQTNGPSKWPGPRIRNYLNPVIDSLIKEGKLEDPVIPPLSPSGSFYDQKDCLAVIQYLADNPSLFYGPTEVPRGASTRIALWGKFEAKYKTRTAIALAEFHRGHHSALEKAARKLISIRKEREHDDPWHESSSSSTVYGNAESQPSARASSVLGFIWQIPSLLKRSVQDDAESSGPSKRVKFEDS